MGSYRGGRSALTNSLRCLPSRYEVNLVLNGVRHEYGFELDDEQVIQEWAHYYPRGKAALLFDRQSEAIRFGAAERSASRAVLKLLRPNALFLSTAAAIGHPALTPLYQWFGQNLRLAEADSRLSRQVLTAEMLDDGPKRQAVLQLLQAADLGITGVRKQTPDPAMQDKIRRAVSILIGTKDESDHNIAPDPADFRELTGINLVHRGDATEIELDNVDESLGTLVWFGLVGPVIESLTTGAVLLADELDASPASRPRSAAREALPEPKHEPETRSAPVQLSRHVTAGRRRRRTAAGTRPDLVHAEAQRRADRALPAPRLRAPQAGGGRQALPGRMVRSQTDHLVNGVRVRSRDGTVRSQLKSPPPRPLKRPSVRQSDPPESRSSLEGEKTEPGYLTHWYRSPTRDRVQVDIKGGLRDPVIDLSKSAL